MTTKNGQNFLAQQSYFVNVQSIYRMVSADYQKPTLQAKYLSSFSQWLSRKVKKSLTSMLDYIT